MLQYPWLCMLFELRIPTDRLRWTLTHEVGHIVMHRFPTDGMEREADQFAAEFLMPAREIQAQLFGVTLPRLAALKPYWRVAMSQMGMRGYRTHEPVDIPAEEPTLLKELLDFHRKELGLNLQSLAKMMCVKEAELLSEYPVEGPRDKKFGGMRVLSFS
jgi:Zn-dependent peptidase ImmA (M78 family)